MSNNKMKILKNKQFRKKNSGFNIIELLIAMTVLAVLAGIAIPIYQNYTSSVHRKAAITDIMSLQQRLERSYTFNNGAYRHLNNESTVSVSGSCNTESNYTSGSPPKYRVTINIPAGGQSYTITATACTAAQLADDCGQLRINEHDIREVKKGSAAWAKDSGCF